MKPNMLVDSDVLLRTLLLIPPELRDTSVTELIDKARDASGSILIAVYHDHRHGGSIHHYRITPDQDNADFSDLLCEFDSVTFEMNKFDDEWIHRELVDGIDDLRPEPSDETIDNASNTGSADDRAQIYKAKLTLDVAYDTSDSTLSRSEVPDVVSGLLRQIVRHAYGEGLLSGGTGLTVDTYHLNITSA